jgi:hypothetical protein
MTYDIQDMYNYMKNCVYNVMNSITKFSIH